MFGSILVEQNSCCLLSYLLLKSCQTHREGKATRTQSRAQCGFQHRVEQVEYQKPGHTSLQSPDDTSAAMAQIQKHLFRAANLCWWVKFPGGLCSLLFSLLTFWSSSIRVGWAPPSPACLLLLWVALCLPSFAFLQITTLQASLCQVKGLGTSLVA